METRDVLNNQQKHSTERQKVTRLIDYLMRLTALRSKLVRGIDEYEKVLWLSNVPHERGCFTQAWGHDKEHDPDEWLEVKSQREPELPTVPAQCKEWLNHQALRNKADLPELLPEITRQIQSPDWREGSDQPKTIPHTERLENHPHTQRAWDCYVEDKWWPWTEEHNSWEKAHKVYSALFAIHQEQLRLGEEYELVLGLGLFTWKTPSGHRVRRHLVVADAIMEFEARLGKFTVRPHTEGAKLRPELDMLDIEEQPADAENKAKKSLAEADDNPWEKSCIEGVLQAMVHSISPQGIYEGSLATKNIRASEKPIVEYAPALILRKRSTKGLTETLKQIKEQIEKGGDIPGEFADLAEIHPNNDRKTDDGQGKANVVSHGEIFFPKPSNEEQRRIVDMIQEASGVLVQGPPGTGKSHTIANLIAHLLATGQRILVTAKTPRALQVLMGEQRDQGLIDKEIRPLCISLLGSGTDERKSLESSVGGILRKNEEWKEDDAKRERTELEERLRKLREENANITRQLRDIRESETHTQSIAGGNYRGTAARIAEEMNRVRANYEWFTDTVHPDKTCQISTDDLRSVLSALRQFTPEKRRELGLVLPDDLPSSERFVELVRNETSADEAEHNAAYGADERLANLLAKSNPPVIEAIRDAFSTFRDTHRGLRATTHPWMDDALQDILGGNSSLWQEIFRVTRDVIKSIEHLVAVADSTRIEFPDTTDLIMLHDDTRILKKHMENGGKLGWGLFRPKSVKERLYVIKAVKIGGRPCSTVEHFSTLADVLHVRIECKKAWGFWEGRSKKLEGPYKMQLAALKSRRDALENTFALKELVARCREAISQCPGMGETVWADESQVEKIISSCILALARIRKRQASEKIQNVEAPISRMNAKGNAHPVIRDLLSAIRGRDMDEFARCVNTILDLKKQRQHLDGMDEYLSRISRLLPQFTNSLKETCNEPYWEERIQRIADVWHWAQARYWIEEYIRQEDVPALARRAKQIEDEINSIIAKLASLHAWSFCFSRLKEEHRSHMVSWQQSMKRLGKGTGKHAPRHRREAQEHLNKCREAVPAWVMPLHRVWDTVSPESGMFDVIIVDEASQCGLEALPLLYLGKKILIVGDDKQISPDAVGLPRDAVHRLMDEFLHDFQFRSSFDIESSLFDHGILRHGTRRITLREHFRCMPEIIRFSNDLCYSDTPLIPLRQYGPDRLPPLEHVFVSGGHREGSDSRVINRKEAEAITQRIVEMCDDSRYDNKTMGVVVLQGEAQAALIERQLLERLGAEEMERRRLICGNPYSFQGDERDIVILSLVAANNERIGHLTKAADERRFNVAASRERDQMILFHSVTRDDDISTHDLRLRLLDFFDNTRSPQIAGIERDELERRAAKDNRSITSPPKPFDSWFEVDVALELLRRGFIVIPQYEVAGKWIDLVVEGGQARLAVECDGDKWHGAGQYEADMQRQRQLERCGWEFFRVRESTFYANKEGALAGLWQALEERKILARSSYGNKRPKESCKADEFDKDIDDTAKDAEDDYPLDVSKDDVRHSGRRPEEITEAEIQEAIVSALSKCPNQSCTIQSLAGRVLKEVGVLTRGKPRKEFERRTRQIVDVLEKQGQVETYRAKNQRLRLVSQEKPHKSQQLQLFRCAP